MKLFVISALSSFLVALIVYPMLLPAKEVSKSPQISVAEQTAMENDDRKFADFSVKSKSTAEIAAKYHELGVRHSKLADDPFRAEAVANRYLELGDKPAAKALMQKYASTRIRQGIDRRSIVAFDNLLRKLDLLPPLSAKDYQTWEKQYRAGTPGAYEDLHGEALHEEVLAFNIAAPHTKEAIQAAMPHFRRAIELQPDSFSAHYDFAKYLDTHAEFQDEAKREYMKAYPFAKPEKKAQMVQHRQVRLREMQPMTP